MMMSILHQARSERGVSLIDTMVTLSVIAIVGSMATLQIGTARKAIKGDGAMRTVMAQLNIAREMAVTERRNFEVQFVGDNWVKITRYEVPSGTTVVANVALEGNARYALVPGVPDTPAPDNNGNSSAISFGSALKLVFSPNGTLVDHNGFPVNGTIFLTINNYPESHRAVTVNGVTGRVRGYRWNGSTWTRA